MDQILDGYEKLHELGKWAVKVDDEKLTQLAMQNKIDLSMSVPVSEHDSVTVQEFVSKYNTQASQAISLDPEFRNKIKPPMVRVFIKRGWGLSDEQQIILLASRDIAEKGIMIYQFKRTINSMLTMFQKAHEKTVTPEGVKKDDNIYNAEVIEPGQK